MYIYIYVHIIYVYIKNGYTMSIYIQYTFIYVYSFMQFIYSSSVLMNQVHTKNKPMESVVRAGW